MIVFHLRISHLLGVIELDNYLLMLPNQF